MMLQLPELLCARSRLRPLQTLLFCLGLGLASAPHAAEPPELLTPNTQTGELPLKEEASQAPELLAPKTDAVDPLQTISAFGELLTPASEGGEVQLLGDKVLFGTELWNSYNNPPSDNIWYGPNTAHIKSVVQFIGQIESEGLLPQDYHYPVLQAHCNPDTVEKTNIAACELLMSDAFLTLVHHIARGKIHPQSVTPEWRTKIAQINAQTYLMAVKAGQNPLEVLLSLRPKAPAYYALLTELKTMRDRAAVAPPWPLIETKPSIKDQMEDPRLPLIVERLKFWGHLDNNYVFAGKYDAVLQEAVRRFQQHNGLDGDGVSGKSTLLALNASPAYRVQQLIANVERWRWLPVDLGHKHIIVNIPSFELKGVIGNQVVLQKPVIVGRNYRRTSIFSSKISQIVFNPLWTVPTKLAVEDKLPEIQRDLNFFNKLGIVVYERDRIVDVAGVNWRRLNKNNFPFRLVQQPGPQNALGVVKFMLPNTDDIYLHDTPSRNLFSRAERAFSSGCVRVHKPLELALWLLEDQGWDMARIEAEVANGVTLPVQIHKPIPVHMEYWTAIVDDSGAVEFRPDLYDRDLPLWTALSTPLLANASVPAQ